jgi:hypothetical protein
MAAPVEPIGDVAPLCERLRDATVKIVGDVRLMHTDGTSEDLEDRRTGSGFYLDDGQVVTAWHVVSRLSRIDVCDDAGCQPVSALRVWPEADVAILSGNFAHKHSLRATDTPPIGAGIVVGGFPGDVGFVCGPGHLVGDNPTPSRFLLFDGNTVAEGSSGGPVAIIPKSTKKIAVFATVSGGLTVGTVQFDRAAPLRPLPEKDVLTPQQARLQQDWLERRPVKVRLGPGAARYEDLRLPAWVDVELARTEGDLCVGLFEPTANDLQHQLAPTMLAKSCDGTPIRYTTAMDATIRIGIWSEKGGAGTVELRRR